MKTEKNSPDLLDLQVWTMIESLRVWEDVKLTDALAGKRPRVGAWDCPCCRLWNLDGNGCDPCPISEYSGEDCCKGTPYDEVVWALGTGLPGPIVFHMGLEIDYLAEVTQGLLARY